MLPHERALVQRLTDEPFALLGVNSDGSREDVLPRLQEADITWRNAIDENPGGPWGSKWNVSGFPMLYLVDAEGVIREKWLGNPGEEVMDQKIDELIAEAKTR
jgi:hypothetical protein